MSESDGYRTYLTVASLEQAYGLLVEEVFHSISGGRDWFERDGQSFALVDGKIYTWKHRKILDA